MEESHTIHESTLQPSSLNQLLDQVDALVTAHEQQRADMVVLRSELELARNATREAQQRALTAEQALSEQAALKKESDRHDQLQLSLNSENDEPQEMRVSNSIYSPHLPPNQAIQALDRKVIQELLNEVDSCIALLEN
ncbi:MAG: hypothetical protein O3B45_04640 [Bacteroidetes bacterium]|jgi:hypothetical protein|nr:hypothetical protein [Bacteroidota bacterium]